MAHPPLWRCCPLAKLVHQSAWGVILQHDCWPHAIVDYTFSGVNLDTVPLANHLTLQFGHAILCILHAIMCSNPSHSPVYMIKIDLTNGFYCIHLAPANILLLGVAFPQPAHKTALITFPMALPMGWMNSPPFFCMATKTITDLANAAIVANETTTPHHLEEKADQCVTMFCPSNQVPTPKPTNTHPLALANIFVDDHIALAQGNATQLCQVHHPLLQAIDQVF